MSVDHPLVEPVGSGRFRIRAEAGRLEMSERQLRWLCLVAGPAALPPLPTGRDCGRLLVGQGGDSWDPRCVLPAGHAGACRAD